MLTIRQMLLFLWASPTTMLGLLIGVATLVTGGHGRRRERTIEFHGGAARWLLRNAVALRGGASAMTLGHVIIGQSPTALDRTRRHELIHVEQYEAWGPMFIPAYLACSAWIWLRGGDGYRDNPFERDAYKRAPVTDAETG